MIRVTKIQEPAVLVQNGAGWTTEYLSALAAGTVTLTIRYRYRHPDIKAAVREESHGRCVYCESKVPVGEIDHINPVTHCGDQICSWPNLVLACKECNTYKGDYYSTAEPLINPFVEEPTDFLLIFGPAVMARAGDAKGTRTVLRLRLERKDLLERRAERVRQLSRLVAQWRAQPEGETRKLLENAIREEAADSGEYAAVVRAYVLAETGWAIPAAEGAPATATVVDA